LAAEPDASPLMGRAVDDRPRGLRSTPVPPAVAAAAERSAWERSGFYSSVIKDENTDEREHSETLMRDLIRPAVALVDPTIKMVRSDELATNRISTSIKEHLLKSRIVIADLSFSNRNVHLELGGRQALCRPYVLISRLEDKPELASNLGDERILFLDTRFGRYQSKLEGYVQELAKQISEALSPESLRTYSLRSQFPDFADYIDK
jgi:hypothetical protein